MYVLCAERCVYYGFHFSISPIACASFQISSFKRARSKISILSGASFKTSSVTRTLFEIAYAACLTLAIYIPLVTCALL